MEHMDNFPLFAETFTLENLPETRYSNSEENYENTTGSSDLNT
jgi:hypothetical protein